MVISWFLLAVQPFEHDVLELGLLWGGGDVVCLAVSLLSL